MSLKLYTDVEDAVNDVTGYLDCRSSGSSPVRLEFEANGRGALDFTLIGDADTVRPLLVIGQAVRFDKPSGTPVWRGLISEIEERELTQTTNFGSGEPNEVVEYRVSCVSYAAVLDRRIVRRHWKDTTVGAILDGLFLAPSTFMDGTHDLADDGLSEGTITTAVHNTTIDALDALYKPASYVLDVLAEVTGAQWIVQADKSIDLVSGAQITGCHRNYLNGGFESGDYTGWETWGTPNTQEIVETADEPEIFEGNAFWGTYAHHHVGDSSDEGIWRGHASPMVVGHYYTASVYCYAEASTDIRLQVGKGSGVHTDEVSTPGTWERLSITFIATNTRVEIYLGGIGAAYFDNCQFEIDPKAGGPSTYCPYPEGVPRDWSDLVVRRHADRYYNAVYAVSTTRGTTRFQGNGIVQTFELPYLLVLTKPAITVWSRTGGNNLIASRRVSQSTTDRFTIIANGILSGGGFTNQPKNGGPNPDAIKVKSTNANDTMNCTVVYVMGGGNVEDMTVTLNGTSFVTFPETVSAVYAMWLSNSCEGTVTLYRHDGTSVICSIGVEHDETGVGYPTDGDDIFIGAEARLDAPGTGYLAIKYVEQTDWTTESYDDFALDGANWKPLTVARSIVEVYTGDLPSARDIIIEAEHEWEYTIDDATIQQNTSTLDGEDLFQILGTAEELRVDCASLRFAQQSEIESTEVSNRAADDGTTGLYEHVEQLDEEYTVDEADHLARDMIDWYCRDGSTTFHPRLEVEFTTRIWVRGQLGWNDWTQAGAQFIATFDKHGIDSETFTISRVTVEIDPGIVDPNTNEDAVLVRVRGTTAYLIGDIAARWRAALWTRRRKLLG